MNEIEEMEGLDDVSLTPKDYQLMKKINEIVRVINKCVARSVQLQVGEKLAQIPIRFFSSRKDIKSKLNELINNISMPIEDEHIKEGTIK